jgi:vitamin B12/bleomycin/antimicrobial peptide transport system ATP-binding/permease protein
MDWKHEVLNSSIWLAKTYLVTLLVFVGGMAALARFTVWGQQFWAISGAYFSPRRSWRSLAALALILLLSLMSVRINVLFSYWYNGMYTSMQELDKTAFWMHIYLFAVLATLHIIRSLFGEYVRTAFSIHWRLWLTERLVGKWMSCQTYYLGRFAKPDVDNPEQRIQQDASSLISSTLGLSMGLVESVLSIFTFTLILWNLSGPLQIASFELPRAMVFMVYIYVLIATVFAVWIGRPLIALNFLNEKLNASYRYMLMRVREYAESVALYRGEQVEQRNLQSAFAAVIDNAWASLWRNLKFSGYNFTVSQTAVLFPLLLQGPRLFSGSIKLGDLTQTSEAFGQVQDALSFFRQSYDSFAGYRAVLDRLSGFEQNIAASQALALPKLARDSAALRLQGLSVLRPDGAVLTRELELQVNAGESLLIRGPSGAGKTTLLRSLAGLWPFTQGEAARPADAETLFLSQKPYLPLGSLRSALAYPAASVDDALAREVLQRVQLGQLADQLDLEQDWSQTLSPGEQQRLAFGRALINRPALIFLDEATSAMDSGLEHALYTTLRSALPEAILISVGHRETLAPLHDRALTLARDGSWALAPTTAPAA